jgi:hypothetical protein
MNNIDQVRDILVEELRALTPTPESETQYHERVQAWLRDGERLAKKWNGSVTSAEADQEIKTHADARPRRRPGRPTVGLPPAREVDAVLKLWLIQRALSTIKLNEATREEVRALARNLASNKQVRSSA